MKLLELLEIQTDVNKILHAVTGVFDIPAADINSGDCFNWAAAVKTLVPTAVLYSVYDHAFVKIDNRYYDAEKLNGVKDWRNLPSNSGVPRYLDIEHYEQDERAFWKKWKIRKPHLAKIVAKASGNG